MTVNLVDSLQLERLELDLFRGTTPPTLHDRIFGGQVIAQALLAAYQTVEDRLCHSLHAYFIRAGDGKIPIIFEVDRARDGGSFTTRRVVAIQHGQQIFNMAASFQKPESGMEHQIPPPAFPHWSTLPDQESQRAADMLIAPDEASRLYSIALTIEMRRQESVFDAGALEPNTQFWIRCKDAIGPNQAMQQVVMAFASDLMLLPTALRPHSLFWKAGRALRSASLDHAMWFHRPFNFNDWHLYTQDSPSASSGRGLVRGAFYDEAGVLVASVAQEVMMRLKTE